MTKILLAILIIISVPVLLGAAQEAEAAALFLRDNVEGQITLQACQFELGITQPFVARNCGGITVAGETITFSGGWLVNNPGRPDPGSGVLYITDPCTGKVSDIITASWSTQVRRGFDRAFITVTIQSSPDFGDLGDVPAGFPSISIRTFDIQASFVDPTDPTRRTFIPSNLGIRFFDVADICSIFLVIDEDSIDNGNPPNFFDGDDVNEDNADIGVRAQLPFFANNVGNEITLHTGEVGDEGWFALKTIPDEWKDAGPTTDGLHNFFVAGPGLGTADGDGDREAQLDKIPDVTPLRAAGLKSLEGENVCAVVYDSDVSMNYDPLNGSLKGSNLGIVAFEVLKVTQLTGFSDSSLPQVDIRILDASLNCDGLQLFPDAPAPISSSEPEDVVP